MPFPTTGILDNFTRGDQTPPSASWSTVTGVQNLSVVSNALKGSGGGNNADYWNPATYGPDCEIYITVTTKGLALDILTLLARAKDLPSGATLDGYAIEVTVVAGTDEIRLRSFDNGAPTTLATFNQEINNGDIVGMSVIGNTLTAYVNGISLGTTEDATYPAAGNLVVIIENTNMVLDDFGGGTVSPAVSPITKMFVFPRRRTA